MSFIHIIVPLLSQFPNPTAKDSSIRRKHLRRVLLPCIRCGHRTAAGVPWIPRPDVPTQTDHRGPGQPVETGATYGLQLPVWGQGKLVYNSVWGQGKLVYNSVWGQGKLQ